MRFSNECSEFFAEVVQVLKLLPEYTPYLELQ